MTDMRAPTRRCHRRQSTSCLRGRARVSTMLATKSSLFKLAAKIRCDGETVPDFFLGEQLYQLCVHDSLLYADGAPGGRRPDFFKLAKLYLVKF